MKRFWIISSILILLAAGVFGYSLFHYIQVDAENAATKDQVSTKELETIKPTEEKKNNNNAQVPAEFNDNGMFSSSYSKAYSDVVEMTDEDLAGSVIIGTCDDFSDTAKTDISKYRLAGYVFNSSAFDDKSEEDIKHMIVSAKSTRSGFIAAVDEEGGSVTAITDHGVFEDYNFDSIGSLYQGDEEETKTSLSAVEEMESKKLKLLKECGINLNLAPVVDIATESSAKMYDQALRGDSTDTGSYASFVAKNFQEGGVSVCLKHFPGYGNLEGDSVIEDSRSKDEVMANDVLPFKSGISSNCHFIMMGNMLNKSIDSKNVVSLSLAANKIIREELSYTGLLITENLNNADYSSYCSGKNVETSAILAGNDLILVDDYESAFNNILASIKDGTIPKETIQKAAMRVLAYKYQEGLKE